MLPTTAPTSETPMRGDLLDILTGLKRVKVHDLPEPDFYIADYNGELMLIQRVIKVRDSVTLVGVHVRSGVRADVRTKADRTIMVSVPR